MMETSFKDSMRLWTIPCLPPNTLAKELEYSSPADSFGAYLPEEISLQMEERAYREETQKKA